MEIYFCPECEGKPYTESTKAGTKCPVCKARLQFAEVSEASLAGSRGADGPAAGGRPVRDAGPAPRPGAAGLRPERRRGVQ